jgi:hypothetical protein
MPEVQEVDPAAADVEGGAGIGAAAVGVGAAIGLGDVEVAVGAGVGVGVELEHNPRVRASSVHAVGVGDGVGAAVGDVDFAGSGRNLLTDDAQRASREVAFAVIAVSVALAPAGSDKARLAEARTLVEMRIAVATNLRGLRLRGGVCEVIS